MNDIETTAAAQRAAAITADALGHFWHGIPLQPWTARRELLYLALQDAAESDLLSNISNNLDHLTIIESKLQTLVQPPSTTANNSQPPQTSPDSLIHWSRFLPAASIVLWLAHHQPSDWLTLRADPTAWLRIIEDWADANIDTDELAPAVRLAHTLRTAHRQLMTLPRPDAQTRKRDAGNSLCPTN